MKLGLILFIIGSVVALYLANISYRKGVLKNIVIIVAILMAIYGLILSIQPSQDDYVKFTKTTIVKEKK